MLQVPLFGMQAPRGRRDVGRVAGGAVVLAVAAGIGDIAVRVDRALGRVRLARRAVPCTAAQLVAWLATVHCQPRGSSRCPISRIARSDCPPQCKWGCRCRRGRCRRPDTGHCCCCWSRTRCRMSHRRSCTYRWSVHTAAVTQALPRLFEFVHVADEIAIGGDGAGSPSFLLFVQLRTDGGTVGVDVTGVAGVRARTGRRTGGGAGAGRRRRVAALVGDRRTGRRRRASGVWRVVTGAAQRARPGSSRCWR